MFTLFHKLGLINFTLYTLHLYLYTTDMPCSDSSSSLMFKLDKHDKFLSFEYAKITCGREISGGTGLSTYCVGMDLNEIVKIDFAVVNHDLKPKDEETQFILYSEWDALRSAVGQYLGIHDEQIDTARCQITSIDYTDEGSEVALVILPPREMPKILPCSLGDKA